MVEVYFIKKRMLRFIYFCGSLLILRKLKNNQSKDNKIRIEATIKNKNTV